MRKRSEPARRPWKLTTKLMLTSTYQGEKGIISCFSFKINLPELTLRSTGWTQISRDSRWTTARTSMLTNYRKLMSFRWVEIEMQGFPLDGSKTKLGSCCLGWPRPSPDPHLEMVFRVTTGSGDPHVIEKCSEHCLSSKETIPSRPAWLSGWQPQPDELFCVTMQW